MLRSAGINLKGLFLTTDSGFDCKELRQICKEKGIEANIDTNSRNNKNEHPITDYQYFNSNRLCGKIVKKRILMEHANAWMDSKFETKVANYTAFTLIAFAVHVLRKIQTKI